MFISTRIFNDCVVIPFNRPKAPIEYWGFTTKPETKYFTSDQISLS